MPFCPVENPFVCTFLWSMTPFLELRASIPLGVFQFNLTIFQSVFVSILGGFFVATACLLLFPLWVKFLEKCFPFFHQMTEKILEKTRAQHSKKFKTLGAVFLVLFVAVPLPGSGGISGSILAYLFGIDFKKSILLIFTGIILSASLVGFLTVSGAKIWDLFWGIFGF